MKKGMQLISVSRTSKRNETSVSGFAIFGKHLRYCSGKTNRKVRNAQSRRKKTVMVRCRRRDALYKISSEEILILSTPISPEAGAYKI